MLNILFGHMLPKTAAKLQIFNGLCLVKSKLLRLFNDIILLQGPSLVAARCPKGIPHADIDSAFRRRAATRDGPCKWIRP